MQDQQIEEVIFTLFSPDEVRKLGQTRITNHRLDAPDDDPTSLNSQLMGPIRKGVQCQRCLLTTVDCPGHFAYIEFPTRSNGEKVYILHSELMEQIYKTVQSCCQSCGSPLLSPYTIEAKGLTRLHGAKRLDAVAKESVKVEACRAVIKTPQGDRVCGHPNPIYYLGYEKDRGNFIRYYARNEKRVPVERMARLSARKIHEIFRLLAIDEKALASLGYAPNILPEYMVLENLLVLPLSYRPPRVTGDKPPIHSDLSNIYSEIVNTVETINRHASTPNQEEDYIALLYRQVSTLFNNSNGAYSYSGGRAHRTLKELMTGKGRLIRGYIQGKRVNYCIRSVASPNPHLRLRQVGIPRSLAKIATYPEWVDDTNRARLQRYLNEGMVVRIMKARGPFKGKLITVDLKREDLAGVHTLEREDRVDRWLMGPRTEVVYNPTTGEVVRDEQGREVTQTFEGDYVVVNRQPTLHKESLLGMEVVLTDGETIGMSVNATAPLGLDFDGDELDYMFRL